MNTSRNTDSEPRDRSSLFGSLRPIGSVSASAAELAHREDRNRRALLGSGAALGARAITLAATLLDGPARHHIPRSGAVRDVAHDQLDGRVAVIRRPWSWLWPAQFSDAFLSDRRHDLAVPLDIQRLLGTGCRGVRLGQPWNSRGDPRCAMDRVFAVTSDLAVAEARPAVAAFLAIFLVGLPLSVATQVRVARQEVYVVHLAAAVGSVTSIVAIIAVIGARGGVPALVVAMAAPPAIAVAVNGDLAIPQERARARAEPAPRRGRHWLAVDAIRIPLSRAPDVRRRRVRHRYPGLGTDRRTRQPLPNTAWLFACSRSLWASSQLRLPRCGRPMGRPSRAAT